MRNRTALIVWALMTAAGAAGIVIITWRMVEWRSSGTALIAGGWALALEGIATGYGIRMTRKAWALHRQRRR